MNSFVLKLIGIISMLIDHIGVLFFPKIVLFRIIGRLAYFIFAYLISEGYRKTSSINKYMIRMLVFALVSQFAYAIAFANIYHLNVLFTFLLALFAISLYEKNDDLIPVIIIVSVAQLFNTDYGAYGVLIVFIFHRYHHDFKSIAKYTALLTFFYVGLNVTMAFSAVSNINRLIPYTIQMFSLFSLIIIYYYNGKQGLKVKYLFYVFYPGHMLLLYFLRLVSGMI